MWLRGANWRRTVGTLVTVSLALGATPAAAVDKVACVQAAEAGQRLRSHGQLLSAREQLLVCSSAECPAVVSQDCTSWLGAVQRSLASAIVNARDSNGQPLTDVSVTVDGRLLPERAPTAAIDLDPGEHSIRCDREGFAEAVVPATLGDGDRGREIVCSLEPLQPRPSQPAPPATAHLPAAALQPTPPAPRGSSGGLPWTVWAFGGLGLAGVGTFAGFALSASSDQNALRHSCAPYCPSSKVDPVATKFTVADVSLGVGLVSLGTAALIALLYSSGKQASFSSSGGSHWAQVSMQWPALQNPEQH
jgi:hypothetical protein